MLVDLQTSSIFSAPLTFFPFFLFPVPFLSPGPVSPYKRLPVQRREPGLRHSTQLLLISVHSEGEKMCLPAHTRTNLSRYRKSCKVRDGVCSQLICDTVQTGLKKRENRVREFPGYRPFPSVTE